MLGEKDFNLKQLVFAHLTINSIRNKDTNLSFFLRKSKAIMISETKIDNSFSVENFIVEDYRRAYRFKRANSNGAIILYVRENIVFAKI